MSDRGRLSRGVSVEASCMNQTAAITHSTRQLVGFGNFESSRLPFDPG
jgi:hypothetical protein